MCPTPPPSAHFSSYRAPPDEGLDIVYRDATLLVVNKPAGLLSVPGRGKDKQDCLASRLRSLYPEALIVHRLDMATSGLLLLARNQIAQRRLGDQFARREVVKAYLAVVGGRLLLERGEIDLPLAADWPRRPRQKVDRENGKASLTRYRVLGHDPAGGCSRLALFPTTGRTHQLRVHLAAIGHPIVGDALYGAAPESGERLLLHAEHLAFAHPDSGRPIHLWSLAPF